MFRTLQAVRRLWAENSELRRRLADAEDLMAAMTIAAGGTLAVSVGDYVAARERAFIRYDLPDGRIEFKCEAKEASPDAA